MIKLIRKKKKKLSIKLLKRFNEKLTNSIDIILPSYNCEKYIKQTIISIINQSFKRWKLIIIDDASNEKQEKFYLNTNEIKKLK